MLLARMNAYIFAFMRINAIQMCTHMYGRSHTNVREFVSAEASITARIGEEKWEIGKVERAIDPI